MPNRRTKETSRAQRRLIRNVLMEHWDPIGVRGIEDAEDEYDSYSDRTYVMLMDEQASTKDIADYLLDVATNHMGLSDVDWLRLVSERTADVIISLRAEFGRSHG
jgi:hypothetical protein